jgi:hypothetical protein
MPLQRRTKPSIGIWSWRQTVELDPISVRGAPPLVLRVEIWQQGRRFRAKTWRVDWYRLNVGAKGPVKVADVSMSVVDDSIDEHEAASIIAATRMALREIERRLGITIRKRASRRATD